MMLLDFAAQEREEERIKILSSLVHDKILSVEDAAARAGVSEEIFLQKVAELAENKENET